MCITNFENMFLQRDINIFKFIIVCNEDEIKGMLEELKSKEFFKA